MQYYRCKCGKREAWSSMGVTQCVGCDECGTNLAQSPNDHHPPVPHDFSSHIEERGPDGPVKVPVCRYCDRTKWEIEGHSITQPTLTGVDLIRAERIRQVEEEGWTAEHDDEHRDQSLARAAAVYAIPPAVRTVKSGPFQTDLVSLLWPSSWDGGGPFFSPGDRIRELTKAGALIAAEIDRLKRVTADLEVPRGEAHG